MQSNESNKWVTWVNAVLIVGIAYASASLTIMFIPKNLSINTSALQSGPAKESNAKRNPLSIGKDIAALHLFGKAGDKTVKKVTKVTTANAPETKLNLKLAGVFAYDPQSLAIAIISAGGRNEQVYGIGDTIVGRASLKAVYIDRVIIENQGREETLKLPKDVAPIALPRVSSQSSASSDPTAGGNNGPVTDMPSSPRALRDKLVRNPAMLSKIVSASPYQENGKLVGFRIQPKQNPEILEAQGIMANDIITQVNGISLNSQKQGIRALRKLVKADNIELTILRDGVEVPVLISMGQ